MFEMLRLMSPPVGFWTKCPSKITHIKYVHSGNEYPKNS